MKKAAFLLIGLLAAQAAAERNQENLKILNPQDICQIGIVSAHISTKTDPPLYHEGSWAFEDLVKLNLQEHNVLNGNLFRNDFVEGCFVGMFYDIDAYQDTDGKYIYNIDYSVTVAAAILAKRDENDKLTLLDQQIELSYPIIWSDSHYTTASNLEAVKASIIEFSVELFDRFLVGWRATH